MISALRRSRFYRFLYDCKKYLLLYGKALSTNIKSISEKKTQLHTVRVEGQVS